MSNSSDQDDKNPVPKPSKSQVIFMFGTMADTTWRMFIPIIGLALGGVWIDRTYGTKPFITIIGIIVGTAIAAYLVRLQFKKELPKA